MPGLVGEYALAVSDALPQAFLIQRRVGALKSNNRNAVRILPKS